MEQAKHTSNQYNIVNEQKAKRHKTDLNWQKFFTKSVDHNDFMWMKLTAHIFVNQAEIKKIEKPFQNNEKQTNGDKVTNITPLIALVELFLTSSSG